MKIGVKKIHTPSIVDSVCMDNNNRRICIRWIDNYSLVSTSTDILDNY